MAEQRYALYYWERCGRSVELSLDDAFGSLAECEDEHVAATFWVKAHQKEGDHYLPMPYGCNLRILTTIVE